jgi:hypothetical protein
MLNLKVSKREYITVSKIKIDNINKALLQNK